jgi:DNA recombination protein RmuC
VHHSDGRHHGALNKLSTGKGNLVGRVENFRKLGVQAAKRIDPQLLASESDDSDDADS